MEVTRQTIQILPSVYIFSLQLMLQTKTELSDYVFVQQRFSIAEEPKYTESGNSSEQIDLSLKLSLCGENAEEKILFKSSRVEEKAKSSSMVENGAEEGVCMDRSFSMPAEFEKGLVRFGDLQTMRRVRSRKRLLLEKMRRTAASEAAKFLAVSPRPPPAGAQPLPHSIHELKALSSPCGDSWFEGNLISLSSVC
ncbi:hypothetical protein RJT34_33493 [Clitoria ternatea]|uniref:Uncharacterized protein n=1 Tax=Clitoria ternatea TaxID=43366 RepID=A0AAN9I5K6_CLITE